MQTYHQIFKKNNKTNKENYEPIIILLVLTKVYERLMYKPLYPHFDEIFAKLQCSFRKGFNTDANTEGSHVRAFSKSPF